LSEVNLGIGEISEHKFCKLALPTKLYIAVGYKENDAWHVTLFKIINYKITFVTDFS